MMRRRKYISGLLAGLSAVLCVAAVVGWVRSDWVMDGYTWRRPGGGAAGVVSAHGRIFLTRLDPTPAAEAVPAVAGGYYAQPAAAFEEAAMPGPAFDEAGFRLTDVRFQDFRYRDAAVPYWAIAIAAATPPAVLLVRRIRAGRRRAR